MGPAILAESARGKNVGLPDVLSRLCTMVQNLQGADEHAWYQHGSEDVQHPQVLNASQEYALF